MSSLFTWNSWYCGMHNKKPLSFSGRRIGVWVSRTQLWILREGHLHSVKRLGFPFPLYIDVQENREHPLQGV